jgi:ApbE superfamily uncharacterized protein (UPF0280 family)
MMEQPICARLPDGRRLHCRHGPIDLVLQAFGTREAVGAAERAAVARFSTILEELCGELAILRSPARTGGFAPSGRAARRMHRAVKTYAARVFITPMAAVAGAVADEILAAMTGAAPIEKAYVNNGGDIALYLSGAADFKVGIVDRIGAPLVAATSRLTARSGVGGIATSGWGGRSFSLGIADAVTVLADSAATADAAATVIANAVDLPRHTAIRRKPAADLQPDSDLGRKRVTIGVGALTEAEGHIIAASLFLKGRGVSTRNLALADDTSCSGRSPKPEIALHA